MVAVRQSQRHRLVEPVFIDGSAGTLLDISTTGAHVLGTSPIQPAQRVYLAMKPGAPPLTAFAVWVQYELPKEGPQYRAGVEFTASAAAAVADYVAELTR
jgi:hypothetical protein